MCVCVCVCVYDMGIYISDSMLCSINDKQEKFEDWLTDMNIVALIATLISMHCQGGN